MKTSITFDDFPVDQVGTLATIADVLSWYLVDISPEEDEGLLVADDQMFDAAYQFLTACSILQDDDDMRERLEKARSVLFPNPVALRGRIRTVWPTPTPPTTG